MEFKLLDELEKTEKLIAKGVYTSSEGTKVKAEITWKKLGLYFTENGLGLSEEIKSEFINFQKSWANSYIGD